MAECIECGEYTKYNEGLCYSCYKVGNKSEASEKIEIDESLEGGLNEKDWNYRYNMIKVELLKHSFRNYFYH